ncbi:hypothetical protein G9A89_021106 [Geosiphon pyriformis]|nr:hypothetical protein G9A89_021106 [Geosiphon pyriformis]
MYFIPSKSLNHSLVRRETLRNTTDGTTFIILTVVIGMFLLLALLIIVVVIVRARKLPIRPSNSHASSTTTTKTTTTTTTTLQAKDSNLQKMTKIDDTIMPQQETTFSISPNLASNTISSGETDYKDNEDRKFSQYSLNLSFKPTDDSSTIIKKDIDENQTVHETKNFPVNVNNPKISETEVNLHNNDERIV